MSEEHCLSAMEYSSPLGYNFKLNESLNGQNGKKNESEGKSNENFASSSSEKSHKTNSFDNTRASMKRNSNFDRSSSFGSDHKNKWNSPNQRNWKGNSHSTSISDYYHPSMLQDPWKELMEKESTN